MGHEMLIVDKVITMSSKDIHKNFKFDTQNNGHIDQGIFATPITIWSHYGFQVVVFLMT